MTKHTPGPWEIFTIASPVGISSRIFAKVNDEDIAHIPKEWNQANANLIAAAPELLEVLKSILPYAENEIASLQDLGRDDDDTMEEYNKASDILQSVYAIIKKAEGQENGNI